MSLEGNPYLSPLSILAQEKAQILDHGMVPEGVNVKMMAQLLQDAILMSFINNCVFYKTHDKEECGAVHQTGLSLCTSWGALNRIPVHKCWISPGCCFPAGPPNPTNPYGVMLKGCDEVESAL